MVIMKIELSLEYPLILEMNNPRLSTRSTPFLGMIGVHQPHRHCCCDASSDKTRVRSTHRHYNDDDLRTKIGRDSSDVQC